MVFLFGSSFNRVSSRIDVGQNDHLRTHSQVLAQRTGERDNTAEVMSLRILNPAPAAVLACACVLQGEVPRDASSGALYPVHYATGGNVQFPAAAAVICEILNVMRHFHADPVSLPTPYAERFDGTLRYTNLS